MHHVGGMLFEKALGQRDSRLIFLAARLFVWFEFGEVVGNPFVGPWRQTYEMERIWSHCRAVLEQERVDYYARMQVRDFCAERLFVAPRHIDFGQV